MTQNNTRLASFLVPLGVAACTTGHISDFDNKARLDSPDGTYAFVGQMLAIEELAGQAEETVEADGSAYLTMMLDATFKVRYRILEDVHGHFDGRTIDFVAYDHYGKPKFTSAKFALLYIHEIRDHLIHFKYQYDEVYPTRDGRFAGCGDPYFDLNEEDRILRKPLKSIAFDPPVKFRISDFLVTADDYPDMNASELEAENDWISEYFSEPAFEIQGDFAVCRMGHYPAELYRIRKETGMLSLN